MVDLPYRTPERVHMVAVCGTGMGSLGLLLREAGAAVTGSDVQTYPPMGDLLRKAGVEIRLGYSAENVPADAQYVVIGNTISRDNPEVLAVQKQGLPYSSFPMTLSKYFLRGRQPLVVVGTHGKTTSSALLAWLLQSAGAEPGFLVGGEPRNFAASSQLGRGPQFVVEGDEYDSAFFDKEPKFLHYRPQAALFTSLEYDHADIYPDFESLQRAFARFVRLLPADGYLMVCGEYPAAVEMARQACCKVETYGFGDGADWRGLCRTEGNQAPALEVSYRGQKVGIFHLPLWGEHNALNTLGCLGILQRLGIGVAALNAGLHEFRGVRRRQETVAEVRGILLVDDFAHHPTAVRETLRAIRRRWPDRRVIAVFEPRTHTSRRNIFQKEFAQAFAEADVAICTKVYRQDSVEESQRFLPEVWVEDLKEMGTRASHLPEPEALIKHLCTTCSGGDIVVFMSSASPDSILKRLVAMLGKGS